MSISHTPGPWRVVGRDPTLENVRFGHWDVEGKSNVASSCTYHDACLIAAAPDLLSAVIQYRDDLRHPIDEGSRQRRLAMVEALISKATSRQPEGER